MVETKSPQNSLSKTKSEGFCEIDFHLMATLARETGVCIEVEESGRLYRFRPVPLAVERAEEPTVEEPEPIGPPPDVMTPASLSKRWRCSERHIRNLISAGKLECFYLGGKLIRIRGSAIEEYEGKSQISTSDKALENGSEAVMPPGKSSRKKPARRLDMRSR